jgi:molybdenum cofactor cytidylyltransferase
MDLTLVQALRLSPFQREGYRTTSIPTQAFRAGWSAAFVGAGGKTSAIFQLARQLEPPVLVTTTTHLGAWQIPMADEHVVASEVLDLARLEMQGITLVTGPLTDGDRAGAVNSEVLGRLRELTQERGCPLLIEADGSRRRPLKAPAEHEPVIPNFVDLVVTVAGLSGLGKSLDDETVHHSELFAVLGDLAIGSPVSADALTRVLISKKGGCKGLPPDARKVILLNQADTEDRQATARAMVPSLLNAFDAVVVASLGDSEVFAVHERTAGIILAAGASQRFGRIKQLLEWRGQPFVRAVAKTALAAGLSPVIVVTGAAGEEVGNALDGLPISIVRNTNWGSGQASSLRAGLSVVPEKTGSVVFLLADQPQITKSVVDALMEVHASGLQPIVAPLVMMERRANPVLFDRSTFRDLQQLEGDAGGRGIFSQYPVEYMPWYDDRLLLDVDTEEDYRRLVEDDTL